MRRKIIIALAVIAIAAGAFVATAIRDSYNLFQLAQYCRDGCSLRVLDNGVLFAARGEACPRPQSSAADPLLKF